MQRQGGGHLARMPLRKPGLNDLQKTAMKGPSLLKLLEGFNPLWDLLPKEIFTWLRLGLKIRAELYI